MTYARTENVAALAAAFGVDMGDTQRAALMAQTAAGAIPLEQFGWPSADPLATLTTAIQTSNRDLGRALRLPDGAVLELSANLPLFDFPVQLVANPAKPALIRWTNNTGQGLRCEGPVSAVTTLAANAAIYGWTVTVADAAGVQVGDLMVLSSNRLWPTAPTDQNVRCGEVSMVIGIAGNVVTLMDPLRDSYTVAEGSTVTFYRALRGVRIEGVDFEKPAGVNECVRINYAFAPEVIGGTVRQAGNAGITFIHCYTPKMMGVRAEKVRTSPSYALRDIGSVRALFNECHGLDNTKTIDITGLRAPSRDAHLVNCHDSVTPLGAGSGICFGSHWGADGTRFTGLTGHDRTYGINTRGMNEVVENCKLHGGFDGSILYMENPRGTVAKGNVYDGPGLANADKAAPSFVRVTAPNNNGSIFTQFMLLNNEMRGIRSRVVFLDGSGVEWKDFTIAANTCRITNASTANALAVLDTTDTTGSIHNFNLEGNYVAADSGQTNLLTIGTAAFARLCALPGQRVQMGKTTLVNVADASAQQLLIGSAGDGIEVTVRCEATNDFYFHGLLFRDGTLVSFGANSNVVGRTGSMSGTTGSETAGKLAISFTGSRFYVQNRTSAARKVYITVNGGA